MGSGEPVPFISRQRVYWDMLDLLGVLHNAAYILLFERARTDFWRSLGIAGYGAEGMDWPYLVARNEVNYRDAVRTEQEVAVYVWIAALGRSSLTFGHAVYSEDGALVADGRTVIVRIDAETRRPTPWSEAFRARLEPHVRPDAT